MTTYDGSIGVAFALVIISGLCSGVGALVVLFVKRCHTHLLAGALGLAAGVMLFVSFTEVLPNGTGHLQAGGMSVTASMAVSFAFFFGAMPLCLALDAFAHFMLGRAGSGEPVAVPAAIATADALEAGACGSGADEGPERPKAGLAKLADSAAESVAGTDCGLPAEPPEAVVESALVMLKADPEEFGELSHTGLLAAVALAIHNLPEGLATFVGYMSSPTTGLAIAIAITLHNIPEGVIVAVPVFFATGSRLKAIMWALLAGMAEIVGALIGLIIVETDSMNNSALGMTMSLVAGIMVFISLQELLPRALQFQTARTITLWSTGGMVIMALSLVLLSLWTPAQDVQVDVP